MTLPPPPRSIRLTAHGTAVALFMIPLLSAMLLGPPVSFLVKDRHEETLLARGVPTRFDLTASRKTREDDYVIEYVFTAPILAGGTPEQRSRESVVSDEVYAAFADPAKRFVLYDLNDPQNAIPVASRSALAKRHAFDRKVAILAYPSLMAIALLPLAFIVQRLRRKLRLLRCGTATDPVTTELTRSEFGSRCIRFQFRDRDGELRDGSREFLFRLGIGGDFTPYMNEAMKDAVAIYDPEEPRDCELFLPYWGLFRFATD